MDREVKKEYEDEPAASDGLPSKKLKVMEVLKSSMQNDIWCFEWDFQSLTETNFDTIGQTLQEIIYFIIKDHHTTFYVTTTIQIHIAIISRYNTWNNW